MRSTFRAVICGAGIVSSVLSLSLLASPAAEARTGGAGVTPAETTPTWTLVDYQTRVCVDAAFGRKSYVFAWPAGTWTKTIQIDLEGLPPGSTSSPGVIGPGSSDGGKALGGVIFTIPPTPVGVYDAALWATDGTVRHSVPVTIDVRTRC